MLAALVSEGQFARPRGLAAGLAPLESTRVDGALQDSFGRTMEDRRRTIENPIARPLTTDDRYGTMPE
jgi:hypothetical protein